MEVIISVLGLLSSITYIMCGLATNRLRMLLLGMATNVLCIAMYTLSHSTLALIVCCIGITRTIFVLISLKYPVFGAWPFVAAVLAGYAAAFAFGTDWNNFVLTEVLPVVGAYLGTLAIFFKRMTITKVLMLASGLVWLIYEFTAGFYTQMIGEIFTLLANSFALMMVIKAEQVVVNKKEIQNVDSQGVGDSIVSPAISISAQTTFSGAGNIQKLPA